MEKFLYPKLRYFQKKKYKRDKEEKAVPLKYYFNINGKAIQES